MNLTELVERVGAARPPAVPALGELRAGLSAFETEVRRAQEDLAAATQAAASAGEAEATRLEERLVALEASLDRWEAEAGALARSAAAAARSLEEEARAVSSRLETLRQGAERVGQSVRGRAEAHRAALQAGREALGGAQERLRGAMSSASTELGALHEALAHARSATSESTGRALEAVEGVRRRLGAGADGLRDEGRAAVAGLGAGLEEHLASGVRSPLADRGREIAEALAPAPLEDAVARFSQEGLERARRALEDVGARAEAEHRGLDRLEEDLPRAASTVRTCVDRAQARREHLEA